MKNLFLETKGTILKREEKSLHQVAIVVKFLDENKPKVSLTSQFALFQTSLMLRDFI